MLGIILEFEKRLIEIEKEIEDLKKRQIDEQSDLSEELQALEEKVKEIYNNLSTWERVQLARHPERPYTLDYLERIASSFIEIHGDRLYSDDTSIVAGLTVIDDYSMVVVGQQKGRDLKSNLYRNFGMANPEGYRKAMRIMKLAAKFNKPIVSLIDTQGAFPGKGAEERGISEAIARNMFEMALLPVPILCIVIGEGSSGGAIAIGIGDRVLMLENAIYTVITPEGCASILFRDAKKAVEAAESMKISAQELLKMELIDGIIPEPLGGAHRDYNKMASLLKETILTEIEGLRKYDTEDLIEKRIEKFGKMGFWSENEKD